jgi:hypothetical protein
LVCNDFVFIEKGADISCEGVVMDEIMRHGYHIEWFIADHPATPRLCV